MSRSTLPAMGIALSTTETEKLLAQLTVVFTAADQISHNDVGQRALDIRDAAKRIGEILEAGLTTDRLEVFLQKHTGGVLVASTEQWYARRVAANNEIRWVTEAYTREEDAYRGGYGGAPDLKP